MKRVRYTKYIGDLTSDIDLEELLQALSDYLLSSGYYDPFTRFQDLDHNLDDLREALRRVLASGNLLDETLQQRLNEMSADGTLDEFIDKLIERMERENYISSPQPGWDEGRPSPVAGQVGQEQGEVRFEEIGRASRRE